MEKFEKDFVPPKESLELKQLGFDEPCFKAYTEDYMNLINISNYHTNTSIKDTLPTKPFTAPLFQQAFRWFRDKHNLPSWVYESTGGWFFKIVKGDFWIQHKEIVFKTYEEAELECLRQLINLTKNSNGSKK